MARLEFKLPDIGEGVAEAEIVEWHAESGDAVAEGQTIVAVMTDKATVELEAPASGILLERYGETGEVLAVGSVLFALETSAAEARQAPVEPPAGPPPQLAETPSAAPGADTAPGPEPARRHSALAAPAVRQRAKVLGIDLASVTTSDGLVRHEDLDRHLQQMANAPSAKVRQSGPQGEEVPLTGLRRQIARRMQEAHKHIPHFTFVDELDVTALERHREELNSARGDRQPIHLLPFLIMALCRGLREFPILNAHYDDEREVLTRHSAVHVGIATQTEGGLMVPVLRDAGALDLWQIAERIAQLAASARSGEIARDDLHGSTITVSSLGKLGGIAATPIINRPEVAILAPHRIFERQVLAGRNPEWRKVMNLSISCDHRVIDGYVAAAFVQAIRRSFAEPEILATA